MKPILGIVEEIETRELTKEEMEEAILSNPTMTKTQKRVAIEILRGLRKPKGTRQKYANKEERKAAAKVRAKKRRADKIANLPESVRPSPRVKLSPEEKKYKRRERGQARRERTRNLVINVATTPDLLRSLKPETRDSILGQLSRMRKKPEGLDSILSQSLAFRAPRMVDTSGFPGMPPRGRGKK